MKQQRKTAPYSGLRVLDFGHYIAGPLAAMLFGDQGADVVRIDSGRSTSMGSLDAVLQRNKATVQIDLKTQAGVDQALGLIEKADVLIENFRPGVMDRLGLGQAACRSLNPKLIYLSLPGFASADEERAKAAAWEGVLGAATGLFTSISFVRDFLGLPPVYSSLPLPSVYGAVHGAAAVAMALVARERTGQGDHIEVPLAAAFMSAMGGNVMCYDEQPDRYNLPPVPKAFMETELPKIRQAFSNRGRTGEREALKLGAKLSPPMMATYECRDSKKLYVFAMDHRRMSRRLLQELNIYDQFKDDLTEQDPYAPRSVDNNISDVGTLGKSLKERLGEAMSVAFKLDTALAWEQRLNDAGIPCAVHRSTAEWLEEAHPNASAIVAKVEDPIFGPMSQPGLAIWVEGTPQSCCSPNPRARELASLPAWSGHTSRPPSREPAKPASGCLAGVRVLDLSTMIAGPACGRTLAEYGAEVIKVDAVAPYLGPRMTIWYAAELNQGKRSILLDLKQPEGKEAFLRLVESADVVLHNIRPGVLENLGLGIDALRQRKPDIIECSVTAFDGPKSGPWAGRPGYDPVLQAAAGITTRYGNPEAPELHATASTLDYLAGFLAAFGTATSLYQRSISPGTAPMVKTSLAQAAMLAQIPFSHSYKDRVWDEPAGQETFGPSANSRMYRALDGWLYVHCEPRSLTALAKQPSFLDLSMSEDLEQFLAKRIASLAKAVVLDELRASDIGVHEVVDLQTMRGARSFARAEFQAIQASYPGTFAIIEDRQHPSETKVCTVAPLYARLRENPLRVGASNEKHGHSTIPILEALGYRADDIASLKNRNVIATELCSVYLPS